MGIDAYSDCWEASSADACGFDDQFVVPDSDIRPRWFCGFAHTFLLTLELSVGN